MAYQESKSSVSAPRNAATVRDFVNTTDHELGTDDIDTPAGLTRFLFGAGLVANPTRATADDLALAHELRRGLRRALELKHDGRHEAVPGLDAALSRLPLELRWDGAAARLVPVRTGIGGGLSRVVLAMHDAVGTDDWRRLKICWSDECEWAYFDASKNRSRSWCEYGCGNRAKVRAYRVRRRAATPDRPDGPDSADCGVLAAEDAKFG